MKDIKYCYPEKNRVAAAGTGFMRAEVYKT